MFLLFLLCMRTAESDYILQSHHQQIHHIRPEFRTPLTNIAASVGQPVQLECGLVGEPKPSIFWKINGKPLLMSDRIKVSEMSTTTSSHCKVNIIKLIHGCRSRSTLQLSQP